MGDKGDKGFDRRLDRIEERLKQLEGSGAGRGPGTADDTLPGACAIPDVPARTFAPEVSAERAELIRRISKKWANGTQLHFYFFDPATAGSWVPSSWVGDNDQKEVVRESFEEWKDLGIGLTFDEASRPEDAEIKIGFAAEGSWSYVGRDGIDYAGGANERTMNFGWDLTTPYGRDTALHEIGHALGFPHEHQNPNAGLVWDEPRVIQVFGGHPNYWDEAKTRRNVIDKMPSGDIDGSDWDPDSIMHYGFPAGLILHPARYQTEALSPDPGLSDDDKDQVRLFYPPPRPVLPELRPFEAQVLDLAPAQQADFQIRPDATRWYDFRTFGPSDTVMVLFEQDGEDLSYRIGDDDSGSRRNAAFEYKLVRDRTYVLRVRLYWAAAQGRLAVMTW